MKKLEPVVAGGSTFEPVYTVNDWGSIGYFIGHSPKEAAGCRAQTDVKVERPFRCWALFPDETVEWVEVVRTGTNTDIVSDHGKHSTVRSPTYGVKQKVRGVEVAIDLTNIHVCVGSLE